MSLSLLSGHAEVAVVLGGSDTALAGAPAANARSIPLVRLEAGLRGEGIAGERIAITGSPVVEAISRALPTLILSLIDIY